MQKFKNPEVEIEQEKDVADLDINAFAKILRVKPGTVRRSLCVKGHYMGIKPKKLPNGHNRFSSRQTKALVEVI